VDFGPPLGVMRALEVPTIDTLTMAARHGLEEYHTWFALTDQPSWLFPLIRLLRPDRYAWRYRLVESIARWMNDRETAEAIEQAVSPEAVLVVRAGEREARVRFMDGAEATACLPVHLAEGWLRGEWREAGVLSPLDLVEPGEALDIAGDVVVEAGGS